MTQSKAHAAPTLQKQRGEKLKEFAFKPGQSGNPAGRPKGSRNKLGEEFLAALHDDFLEHGPETIERMRQSNPVAYIRVVASLLPREIKVDTDLADLSDEELDRQFRANIRGLKELGYDLKSMVDEDDPEESGGGLHGRQPA